MPVKKIFTIISSLVGRREQRSPSLEEILTMLSHRISLAKALTGYRVYLTTLDGKILTKPFNNVIQ